jgi:hypothetical protein
LARLLEPLLLRRLELVQAQIHVLRIAWYRCGPIKLATGVLQLQRIEKMSALVALVSSGVIVVAQRTGTLDKTIR